MPHEPPVKPAVRILRKASNVTHHFFAPCPRGLAGALAEELTALGAMRNAFARGENRRSHVFYRVVNEVPLVLLVAIVILVVVKPF